MRIERLQSLGWVDVPIAEAEDKMAENSNDCPIFRNDNPFAIEAAQDAIELYDELRSKCPVKKSDAAGGFYWLTKYADVRAAARDAECFSSARKGVMLPPNESSQRFIALEMDAPEHGPWRRFYAEALAPARLKAAEPDLIAIANELIDKFAQTGECDVMKDYAEPYPVLGVCKTIGITGPSVERIRQVSEQFVQSVSSVTGDVSDLPAIIAELGGLMMDQVLRRRTEPQDDYLTEIASAEIDGRKLSDAEIEVLISGFLTAGHESTTSALGTLLFHVILDPGLKERILSDDGFIAGAVEESVRLYPPFQAFHRTTSKSVEMSGVTIPENSTVRLSYAAANRDPDVFEHPHNFDPHRAKNLHIGFGFGPHTCVGANLARLEMRIALRELLRRLPDIRLTDEVGEWKVFAGNLVRPAPFRAIFTPTA